LSIGLRYSIQILIGTVKYSYSKGIGRAIRFIKIHPNHNNQGVHFQLNKWILTIKSTSSLKEGDIMEIVITESELNGNKLLDFENSSLLLIREKIDHYKTQIIEMNLDLKIQYFWENSLTRVLSWDRIPFTDGYTMYMQIYLYKGLKPIEIAGGETDDLGYFTSILHIQKKKRMYHVYVNFEFSDYENRIYEIINSIKQFGYK